jgi:uncharacterized membrane protein YqaE (UPF0057 family)
MKKLFFVALAAGMLSASPSHAGFIMKKKQVAIEQVAATAEPTAMVAAPSDNSTTSATQTQNVSKKQTIVSKLLKKASPEISKSLYVVLAIFWLGWLAMGINDNFEGWDWVISLLLYCILWLPGFIYTLVKMKKYYK